MSNNELTATLSRIFVYPVKSCAGVELQETLLLETGLEFDRAWMVVDEHGEFLTQRELPRMALIKPQLKQYEMVLRAPGMLALHIALDAVEQPCKARIWGETCKAYDMGDVAAQWFTDFLMQERTDGVPAIKLRLVRFDPEQQRLSDKTWTHDVNALNQFSDGYPLLVLSQASLDELNRRLQAAGHAPVGLERFRPNLVLSGLQAHDEDRSPELRLSTEQGDLQLALVKPCSRCSIPDINPASALFEPHVSQVLQTYRQDARLDGAISFGMNAIVKPPATGNMPDHFEYVLRVGQRLHGRLCF